MNKLKIVILALFITLTSIKAQKDQTYLDFKDIKTEFEIYLDNELKETDKVSVGFKQQSSDMFIKITNQFTTFLQPNKLYNFVITHPGYNKQFIDIATTIISPTKIKVYLNKDEPDCILGRFKYNKLLKTYINYE